MLDVQEDCGLLILTLSRGALGNPLNKELLTIFENALSECEDNDDIRAVLVRSNTDRFCIGMDFNALMGANTLGDRDALRNSITAYSRVLSRIYSLPKPVVCVISGEVRAGGVGIVCACDIVIATPDSELSLSEVLFGLVPANVLPYLLGLRVSPAKARYLVITSKVLTGREGYEAGLVDELAERDGIERAIRTHVRQIMRSSPKAIETAKRLSEELIWQDLDYRKRRAIETLDGLARNEQVLNAIQAYQEGMVPDWFARYKPSVNLYLGSGHE